MNQTEDTNQGAGGNDWGKNDVTVPETGQRISTGNIRQHDAKKQEKTERNTPPIGRQYY